MTLRYFTLVLAILRYLFLFLIYFFLWQVVRLVRQDSARAATNPPPLMVFLGEIGEADRPAAELSPNQALTIGREADNSLTIGDPYASAHHARLWGSREGYWLEDLGSTNGTLLNGNPVPARVPVRVDEGDRVVIGTTSLRLAAASARERQGA